MKKIYVSIVYYCLNLLISINIKHIRGPLTFWIWNLLCVPLKLKLFGLLCKFFFCLFLKSIDNWSPIVLNILSHLQRGQIPFKNKYSFRTIYQRVIVHWANDRIKGEVYYLIFKLIRNCDLCTVNLTNNLIFYESIN